MDYTFREVTHVQYVRYNTALNINHQSVREIELIEKVNVKTAQ